MDPRLVAAGEIGLSGEIRAVPQLERRINEAARLGFERCLVPKSGSHYASKDIKLIPCGTLREAINAGLLRKE